ncbi:5-(carboxyamino)imidazole ribonucleotide synthase [Meinhardsimonia xiamenensis]|jgi:5-(carboxyamino)imidazole ribonucleotide synthase|uniref:N5-carboxyaminoimidazole ribonucleotide synthase n=1 Tax=Meinhardsimonia xiamenensis TaxID=990712 RepID=A0A1G9EHE1_9RHOB|nr:5-(carboxyamino)imidazole ribonucleotide synthase [Meinhardsimonia xiamenensis]PRX33767.1 5-(carboxyamino)imidazole ribonucleotide synthase [Meinhardsimonia xiamenensis]SDK75524.1 5-(carboxyamino)imidazole ribonucleotide synthase [Meinhardsimonia xiamenensis]
MPEALPYGAVIGILGGGQLARMLSVAAARLGYRCHVYDPAPNPPAAHVAARATTAPWDDAEALERFAAEVSVITYEFENIPVAALDLLEAQRPIRPSRRALAVSQDRLTEKTFLSGLGLEVAPFAPVEDADSLEAAIETVGLPAILKTRRLGYDGKGQVRLTGAEDAPAALQAIAGAPAILEGFVNFEREVSVIAARGLDGTVACFDPGENVHREGILRTTTVPARLSASQRADAALVAGRILNALDYVGVMGVEMFVTPGGLIVNEIAPRVHNSGHWTQQGCAVDQFEQHIRAIAGWPLGDGSRYADVTMENLIGEDVARVPQIARERNATIHLYGKAEVRPGRKMGHVNRITGPAG